MSDEGGSDGGSPLERLLALQDLDARLDQLHYQSAHHPIRAAIAGIDASRSAVAARTKDLEDERGPLESRRRAIEADVGEAERRIAAIESRLTSAAAGSYRDQEAMAAEIESLRRRIAELEDDELEVMEALEPIEAALSEQAELDVSLELERSVRLDELASVLSELDASATALAAERDDFVAPVPDALLSEYEKLRSRLDGVGAARLVRGTCSGCNLSLPSTELDRIRHAPPGTVFHCEQCGRILVP